LGDPAARLSEGFTNIVTLVELSDGRVVVADRTERRLVIGNFATGGVTEVSRVGQGPGEYTSLAGAYPLGADSILLYDAQQRRALILVGEQVVRTISTSAFAEMVVGGALVGASGGALLTRAPTGSLDLTRSPSAADSVAVMLKGRNSTKVDTVAMLGPIATEVSLVGNTFTMRRPAIRAQEEVLLFPDGWLAIARLEPYRVDWRSPQGAWTRGAPLPFQSIRIEDAQKAQLRAYLSANGYGDVSVNAEWPSTVPPFHSSTRDNVMTVGPRGLLLVKRVPTAASLGSPYDVIDRRGSLVARLRLASNERLLAFGEKGVYIAATDRVGLQYITRHAMPAFP
jgi:hypothetical protein